MDLRHDSPQFLHELLPPLNHGPGIANHLHIPYLKGIQKILPVINFFQKLVSLTDHLVVINQIVCIYLIQLTKLQVDEPPPLCRRILDDSQVLRREKNHVQDTEQLRYFMNRNAVHGNTFRTVLLQVHIDPAGNALFLHDQLDMALLRAEADHLSIFAAPVGFRGSAEEHRFQSIRLPLRIISVEHIDVIIKIQMQ